MAAYELVKSTWVGNSAFKAYYRFEETAGTSIADSSGNSNTLTASRVNIINNAGGVYGLKSTYVSASNDNIAGSVTGLPTGSSSFSVAFWLKTTTYNTTQCFFGWGAGSSGNANFARLDTVQHKLYVTFYASDLVCTTTNISDGNWHHVVITYISAGKRTVYFDGQYNNSDTPTTPNVTSTTLKLGTFNGGYYQGDLDDFGVWNIALSADQVKEIYEGRYIGELRPETNCKGLWHLNGNSTDSSGNANNGTDTAITYSFANGKFGQGAGFNGSTSKIVITDATTLKPTGNFTIMLWHNSSNATGELFQTYSQNTAVAGIYTRTNGGKAEIVVGKNTGTTLNTDYKLLDSLTSVNNSIWHHIAFTYNGSTLSVYIDGNLDNSVANTISPVYAATNYVRIGCHNNSGSDATFLTGNLDELALYSRAWTAAEIRKYFSSSKGRYL